MNYPMRFGVAMMAGLGILAEGSANSVHLTHIDYSYIQELNRHGNNNDTMAVIPLRNANNNSYPL